MKFLHFLPVLVGLSCASAADNTELSRQATDPTASLMALNFQTTWVGDFHGADILGEEDEAYQFAFRPVIPFEAFGQPNILRATIPDQSAFRSARSSIWAGCRRDSRSTRNTTSKTTADSRSGPSRSLTPLYFLRCNSAS